MIKKKTTFSVNGILVRREEEMGRLRGFGLAAEVRVNIISRRKEDRTRLTDKGILYPIPNFTTSYHGCKW